MTLGLTQNDWLLLGAVAMGAFGAGVLLTAAWLGSKLLKTEHAYHQLMQSMAARERSSEPTRASSAGNALAASLMAGGKPLTKAGAR